MRGRSCHEYEGLIDGGKSVIALIRHQRTVNLNVASQAASLRLGHVGVEEFQQESMIPAALQHPWDLNECISSPCLHGGTCVDGIVSYECVCTSDFRGDECGVYKLPSNNLWFQNWLMQTSLLVGVSVVIIPLLVALQQFIVYGSQKFDEFGNLLSET